jgi:hypothetical protein
MEKTEANGVQRWTAKRRAVLVVSLLNRRHLKIIHQPTKLYLIAINRHLVFHPY